MFGVMMLLIPATSIASAAEYDKYYKEKNDRYSEDDYGYESDRYYKEKDRYGKDYGYGYDNNRDDRYYDNYRSVDDRKSYDSYQEPYKKVDNKKESDRPVIIVKNKIPIPHQEKEKKKEPPMVLVNKKVLFCDDIANGDNPVCTFEGDLPNPNSDRWVEQCNDEICEFVDESLFKIKVVNGEEFEGSEKGTKLNLEVGKFLVTEERDIPSDLLFVDFTALDAPFDIDQDCKDAGFDASLINISESEELGGDLGLVVSCVLFEGDCSGTVQYGEQKECTVENHVIFAVPDP